MLGDLERRDQEGPHESIISTSATNVTDQAQRIKALIHDLDLVGARQWSQPGWVDTAWDPTVQALIHEGDAAVGPLLDCLEHDKRLTRSVGFGRDFHPDRTVIAVSNAVNRALGMMLQANFAGGAPELRAYWGKYQNLKIEDRWYEILKDDSARARWAEAAGCLVARADIGPNPGGDRGRWQPAPAQAVPVRGEILRSKTNPTVTELLTRRALEFPTNDPDAYDLGTACAFAGYLGRWDPTNAVPVLQKLSKRAATVMKYSGAQLGRYLAQMAIERELGGDPQSFGDFAAWVVTTGPEQFEFHVAEPLEPFERFPTNAVLRAAAEQMFGTTNSGWGRLPWAGNHFGESVVNDKLMALPAYGELLVRELEKTNLCGTISLSQPNYLDYGLTNSLNVGGGFAYTFPKDVQPTNGTTGELRWCDWIAVTLAGQKHIAFFNPFAPVAEREKMIAAAKRKLLGE